MLRRIYRIKTPGDETLMPGRSVSASCCVAISIHVENLAQSCGISCARNRLHYYGTRGRREPIPESARRPLGRPAMLPDGLFIAGLWMSRPSDASFQNRCRKTAKQLSERKIAFSRSRFDVEDVVAEIKRCVEIDAWPSSSLLSEGSEALPSRDDNSLVAVAAGERDAMILVSPAYSNRSVVAFRKNEGQFTAQFEKRKSPSHLETAVPPVLDQMLPIGVFGSGKRGLPRDEIHRAPVVGVH